MGEWVNADRGTTAQFEHYHRAFVVAYYRAFGTFPPKDFLEAYDELCYRLYFGTRGSDGPMVVRRGRSPRSYDFAEPRLLRPKGRADSALARAAEALGPHSRGG